MPQPDEHLNVPAGTQTTQTAHIMQSLERSFTERRPGLVLVVGDVNSTLAAALVGAKLGIPIAHVEAGLRSFDRRMPEEINRIVTDALSDYLFVSEPSGIQNLRAEGVSNDRIFFVGNVMIDTLLRFRKQASQSDILNRLGVEPGATQWQLCTVPQMSMMPGACAVSRERSLTWRCGSQWCFRCIRGLATEWKSPGWLADGLLLTPPLGYLDFLRLTSEARVVLTDSGGIQEETTILGVPCLTLRENTERPVTTEVGTNRLVGVDPDDALKCSTGGAERAAGPWPDPRTMGWPREPKNSECNRRADGLIHELRQSRVNYSSEELGFVSVSEVQDIHGVSRNRGRRAMTLPEVSNLLTCRQGKCR